MYEHIKYYAFIFALLSFVLVLPINSEAKKNDAFQKKLEKQFLKLVKDTEKIKPMCEQFDQNLNAALEQKASDTNKTIKQIINILEQYPQQPAAINDAASQFQNYHDRYSDLPLAGFFHVYTCPLVNYLKAVKWLAKRNKEKELEKTYIAQFQEILKTDISKDLTGSSPLAITYIWLQIVFESINGGLLNVSDSIFVEFLRIQDSISSAFAKIKQLNRDITGVVPKKWSDYSTRLKKNSREILANETKTTYKVNKKIIALLSRAN